MKKLFVSVPMRGRTEESIKNSIECMHKIAEIAFGEELELIDSYIEDTPPTTRNQSIWYLGKSIELLAQADYFIGVDLSGYFGCYPGCCVENRVASEYDIKRLILYPRQYAFFNDIVSLLEDPNRQLIGQTKGKN